MMSETSPKRITMQTIWEYFLAIFNLERGLLYTMQQLTLRPGQAISEFLFTEKRNKHIKPVSFLILTATVSTFITLKLMAQDINITGFDIGVRENDSLNIKELIGNFNYLIGNYFNLFQMLKIPFFSVCTYWFFKKNKFNFAEHLVLNSYIYGYISIFVILLGVCIWFSSKQMGAIIGAITFIYPIYVYIKLFGENLGMSIAKSFAVYLIGNILHLICIGLIVIIMQMLM